MFNLLIGALNFLGWSAYYFLSGGWAAESSPLRIRTILFFLIPSIVGTIGSYFIKSDTDNPIKNIWNIMEFSAFFCSPFINLFYGNADTFHKVVSFFVWPFAYLFCLALKLPQSSEIPFFYKFLIWALVVFICLLFPGNSVLYTQEIFSIGLGIVVPIAIILGIKNTYFD